MQLKAERLLQIVLYIGLSNIWMYLAGRQKQDCICFSAELKGVPMMAYSSRLLQEQDLAGFFLLLHLTWVKSLPGFLPSAPRNKHRKPNKSKIVI